MESDAPPPLPFSSSAVSSRRSPDDILFFFIFPDFSLSQSASSATDLQSFHLDILAAISPYTSGYVWQHEPFNPSPSLSPLPHLQGSLRYGDNLEDEWFAVFLLFRVSTLFPSVTIRCYDSDGEFLLIESAYHLPSWLSPSTAPGRVFIRGGHLHIIPRRAVPGSPPPLTSSLRFLAERPMSDSLAPKAVQATIVTRIAEYPGRAVRNMHRVRVRVPVTVARVLQDEPCLVSLAVEGFYDRDVDSMKHAARMEKFLQKEDDRELVRVSVTMSRVMYAQLMGQTFRPPGCYPRLPSRGEDKEAFTEAELGIKIACGFEMMYQTRKRDGDEGKGGSWDIYFDNLERNGYFQGLLPGSTEYRRLMDRAEDYYRKSSLFSKMSEMLSSPIRRMDEILALPYSMDEFRNMEVPSCDDDSWLYGGEEELNSALLERQKEMDLYTEKHAKKKNAKEPSDGSGPSMSDGGDYDLSDIAKSMQAFVHKMSSYEGAEVPESRDATDVNIDVDRFMKDMESIMKHRDGEDSVDDGESRGSSELDFDESEEESADEDEKDSFMDCYSNLLNQELKSSTLSRSFVHANDQSSTKLNEGGPDGATQEMDEDFTPVDVDVNLVKSFLESFSSQEGLPGPASNLLGLMGLQLPPKQLFYQDLISLSSSAVDPHNMRHNGGGGLRDFVGALKDKASQTRATLHLLPQNPNPYHIHLLRFTTHSPSSPPSLRHLYSLLSLSQSSRASASSLVSSLMDRLCQTRSSAVALKCLFAFHFFLRRGPFILLDQLSFLPLRGGRNYLNLSGFRDDSYPLSWELSGWVRWYAAYLERAVSASRALGHYFLNSASTSEEVVAGSEESKVSSFTNLDLLNEIESLAGLIEETSRIPESCDDNPIVRAIKEFMLDDCSRIVRAVSVRVNEFEERLDLLSFADSVELVCSLKRLETCGERVAEMFDRDEKAAGASRRVWDSIRVMRGKVGEGKKSVEVEPVKGKENGAWSVSARFDGGRIPSSVLFPSGRLGSDFHPVI